jgi:hypothetical protein
LRGFTVDIGDRQFRTFRRKSAHDGATNPTTAAGDDRYFVIDRSHTVHVREVQFRQIALPRQHGLLFLRAALCYKKFSNWRQQLL